MKIGRYGFCALMVLSLTACGGGGSGNNGGAGAGSGGASGSGGGATYTIGGTINGLSASGLVLADNGGDSLTVSSGATSFTFATALQSGASYDVTIATQPTGEICTVGSATGTATANVTSVAVSCKPLYTIGGTVSSLSASGLVLADNGGDNLTLSSGATSFTFATPLPSGGTYDVTVATQPTGETCTVGSATGTATANVTSVAVSCKPLYTIGGTVSGLSASGLVLADNGGDNLTLSSGATSFTFATPLPSGAAYNVTVATQPTGETCSVGAGSGTATANVTSVSIACAVETFTMSGTLSGLTNPGLQLEDYTGGETLSVAANAQSYQFTTPVPYGTQVGVTVVRQPYWEMCSAGGSNFTGPITSNITTDAFTCAAASASGAAVTTSVTFKNPAGVAVDSSGDVYVADTSNDRILEISPSGTVTTLLSSADGLSGPEGVAVNSAGTTLYVADTNNSRILESSGGSPPTQLAPTYSFNQPAGVAVDSQGNVYVADTVNNAIEEISTSGTVTQLVPSFPFSAPSGIAVDSSGNVYVSDTGNSKIVEISGTTVTTLPGTFFNPFGVAVDSAGDVYVADNNDHEVQMITPAGSVTTVAGSSASTGSCTASPPRFYNPYGIAVSTLGNLYVADYFSSQVCELTPVP